MIEILKIAIIYIITDPNTCDMNNIKYKMILFNYILILGLVLLIKEKKGHKFEIIYRIFRPKITNETLSIKI